MLYGLSDSTHPQAIEKADMADCPSRELQARIVVNIPGQVVPGAGSPTCSCASPSVYRVPARTLFPGLGVWPATEMEVTAPAPRNTECQCTPIAADTAGTVSVALVSCKSFSSQTLPPFRHHQALQHCLHKVLQAVFFLRMLAYYLGNCRANRMQSEACFDYAEAQPAIPVPPEPVPL